MREKKEERERIRGNVDETWRCEAAPFSVLGFPLAPSLWVVWLVPMVGSFSLAPSDDVRNFSLMSSFHVHCVCVGAVVGKSRRAR